MAEAVKLLDAEGLDALSMRRLGTRLGAAATSIYWHVASVVVEQRLELRAVVSPDDLDPERQPLQDVVDELDGDLLVELGVDPQHASLVQSSIAVNR